MSRPEAALGLARAGWQLFPLHHHVGGGRCSCGDKLCVWPHNKTAAKHPRTKNGLHDATSDLAQVMAWWGKWPEANIGLVTGSGTFVVDVDGEAGWEFLKSRGVPETLSARTGRGMHLYLFAPEGVTVRNRAKVGPELDVRGDGGYVLAPPSGHASGETYEWVDEAVPIADAPAWLVELVRERLVPERPTSVPVRTDGLEAYARAALEGEVARVMDAMPGTRNDTLNAAAFALGQLVGAGALPEAATEALRDAGLAIGLTERETDLTLRSGLEAGKREPRDIPERSRTWQANGLKSARNVAERGSETESSGRTANYVVGGATSTSQKRESPRGQGLSHSSEGNSEGGITVAEQPLTVPSSNGTRPHVSVPAAAWPQMGEEAYRGLAGDVVELLAPHTEADPVGLLVTFLAQYGALMGPGPHIRLSGMAHPAKLFAVLTGASSARKGAAEGMIRWLMGDVASETVKDRWKKGLTSGEGLIEQVRDPMKNPKTGIVEDEGVADKRLYVFESEFTAVLAKMSRQGNTLSQTIRDAWDSADLESLARSSNALKATGAHIVIVGNAVPAELAERLGKIEVTNGFANRFLFPMVRRSQSLPFGSEPDPAAFSGLATKIGRITSRARGVRRMEFDEGARAGWPGVYEDLRDDIPDGPMGHFLARADTQVLRLALTYALLEASPVIGWCHLESALAVWSYCRESVGLLLAQGLAPAEGTSGDAMELLELVIAQPGILSRDAKAKLSWSGSKFAATRGLAERLKLIEVRERPTEAGGAPAKCLFARGVE